MVFTLKVDKIIDSIFARYLIFYSKNRKSHFYSKNLIFCTKKFENLIFYSKNLIFYSKNLIFYSKKISFLTLIID